MVPLRCQFLEGIRIEHAVLDHQTGHGTSGFLGIKGDHFEVTIAVFLEMDGNQPAGQLIIFNGFEIFLGSQVQHHVTIRCGKVSKV